MTPFLSPFLPNLLRPNLLRPEIQSHSTIPPPACIVGIFPWYGRHINITAGYIGILYMPQAYQVRCRMRGLGDCIRIPAI